MKSKLIRKIQGNALAFHFAPEQPMTRQKPHARNGKGGKQTGMLARGQAWSRFGRIRLTTKLNDESAHESAGDLF